MPLIADYLMDLALAGLQAGGTRLDIHQTAEPTTYAAAIGATSLGNKTSLSIGAPGDRTPNGRKVTVAAFTNGSVTGSGTAAYYSIVDPANTRLLATGALSASMAVVVGGGSNTFGLSAFDIGIPDAV